MPKTVQWKHTIRTILGCFISTRAKPVNPAAPLWQKQTLGIFARCSKWTFAVICRAGKLGMCPTWKRNARRSQITSSLTKNWRPLKWACRASLQKMLTQTCPLTNTKVNTHKVLSPRSLCSQIIGVVLTGKTSNWFLATANGLSLFSSGTQGIMSLIVSGVIYEECEFVGERLLLLAAQYGLRIKKAMSLPSLRERSASSSSMYPANASNNLKSTNINS